MKEHPIIFSTPMVQALLSGKKTQTRRIIKPQPKILLGSKSKGYWPDIPRVKCPYGEPGHLLWVRETHAITYSTGPSMKRTVWYKADNPQIPERVSFKWHPSIHMPKGAGRIWLEVLKIRVERVQQITNADAVAEGVQTLGLYPGYDISMKGHFNGLWTLINGADSWETNPFVWVVEFKLLSTTGHP